ncbi:hypothetical protein [Nostoc sp. ATCC 53789]|uniref:hypothetical protein n=1 Tax=unclassified Nostoc TaxID=2593658 RepID=UPI000DEC3E93|nr:hypothetical protein [Nostoc sp. ATCC 53789]MBD2506943.1 hypothetical protein [Desmonostoc muscorum FACHB-395]QHG19070.1 hypothetical protein GJB62_25995 [Nostoc sp. ATCC 53789]RCJ18816.1 hypothetical protein A6V25_06725 [Nostoc sp. ATCC 53789]
MADKKNDFLSISPSFFSQLLFGAFLTFILIMTGSAPALSIFLGIMGGFILSWITNVTDNSPQAPNVASSDGVDTGLKYWLFFMLGFVYLGYPAPTSILLGGIGALAGGWITAWWGSKEETRTQLQVEELEEGEVEPTNERINKRQTRRNTRRYRRAPGSSINFKFWER